MKNYIGLDAHSSTCSFCVMDEQGKVLDFTKIVTNGRLLIDYLTSLPGRKELTFEECELSTWLYEILKKEVDNVLVCNPVENRQYKKAKTDKLDAYNLANLFRGGFLKNVYHDGSDKEKLRDLMSAYQDLTDDLVCIKNRYKSLFRKEGKRQTGTAVYRDHLLMEQFEREDLKFIAEHWFTLIRSVEQSREAYIKRIKQLGKKHKEIIYLKTLPGIGDISAAQIVSQVIDPHRFRTKYKYYSYCGLVRHRRQSGERVYGDTKIWGNRILKCVYKMAAQSVLRGNSALKTYYDHLRSKGTGHKNAKSAVARKIAAVSLAMLKKGERYKEQMILDGLVK